MEINLEFLKSLPSDKPSVANVWSDNWRFYNGEIYKLEDYIEAKPAKQILECANCDFKSFDYDEIKNHCLGHIIEEDKKKELESEEEEKKEGLLETSSMPEFLISEKQIKKEKMQADYKKKPFSCNDCKLGFDNKKQKSAHDRWNHSGKD